MLTIEPGDTFLIDGEIVTVTDVMNGLMFGITSTASHSPPVSRANAFPVVVRDGDEYHLHLNGRALTLRDWEETLLGRIYEDGMTPRLARMSAANYLFLYRTGERGRIFGSESSPFVIGAYRVSAVVIVSPFFNVPITIDPDLSDKIVVECCDKGAVAESAACRYCGTVDFVRNIRGQTVCAGCGAVP